MPAPDPTVVSRWDSLHPAEIAMSARIANAGPVGRQVDPDSDEWCTAFDLADKLGQYDFDPCSNSRSHIKAHLKLGREWGHDSLSIGPWMNYVRGRVGGYRFFVNYPYSDPRPWVRLAVEAAVDGAGVDLLVKLDPTTGWWETLMKADVFADVWAFRKRIKFERPDKPRITANFPSALVCLNGSLTGDRLYDDGLVWNFGANGTL